MSLEPLPVIIYEPSQDSKIVFEPHPSIAPGCVSEPIPKRSQQICGLSLEKLRTVSPSTLLFQPPLKDIIVLCGNVRIAPRSGVTFGAIVEGFEQARVLAEESISRNPRCAEPYSRFLDGTDDSISIIACHAVANNSYFVKIAREAME